MKVILSILSFMLMINSVSYAADYMVQGDGSVNNPYLINDEYQMNILSDIINNGDAEAANRYFKFAEPIEENQKIEYIQNACYKLSGDIEFDLINGIGNKIRPFKGKFDGSGFSIKLKGIDINAETMAGRCLAVFAFAQEAEFYNVTVELAADIKIANAQKLDGISLLVGDMRGGAADNCKIKINNAAINILSDGKGNLGLAAARISEAAEMRYIYIYMRFGHSADQ